MLTIIMTILSFLFLLSYFCFRFNKLEISKTIKYILSFLLALPSLDVTSILFIFELHFVVISIIFELILWKIDKNRNSNNRVVYIIIPIPLILSLSLMIYGSFNMNHIIRTEYNIQTNKEMLKDYRIAMIADLHYPTSMDEKDLKEFVFRLKSENLDYVMLCGDIVDEYSTVEERNNVFETLGELSNICEVFYVFGNHDTGKYSFNNRIEKVSLKKIIEKNGIHVLEDEQIDINDDLQLIGRKDFSLHNRKKVESLSVDSDKYSIVLDHQPKELNECANNGVDLHLSRHTHAGQIFPLYFIYEILNINELNYGMKSIKQMNAVNTSGVSGWGFPIRTEHHSEYVIINIGSK